MTERFKFEGLDEVVIVDLNDEHPGVDFGRYSFIEHRPIVSFQSDKNRSASEVMAKVGEHRFSCTSCIDSGVVSREGDY